MRRAGFTLLEIVIALALIVAAMSLVGPALLRRIAPVSFEGAVSQTVNAMRTAREDARRTGEPIFVYARPDPGDGSVAIVARREMIDGPAGVGPGLSVPDSGAREAGRHLVTLPSSMAFSTEPPVGEVGPGPETGERVVGVEPFGAVGGLEDSAAVDPLLLAVFLPDGSALSPSRAWLSDSGGRVAALLVDPSIGRVRFVHGPPRVDEAGTGGVAPGPASPREVSP